MQTRWDLHNHADDTLIEQLEGLARLEKHTLADVLAHMAEIDARTLYAELAYSSMRRYAIEHLGYSEAAAGNRVTAACLARRFPTIFVCGASDPASKESPTKVCWVVSP